VSEDLAWAIVRMAPILESSDIAAFTSVSERQQRWILSLWRNTGEVVRHRDRRVKGRPRHLTPDDVAVCSWPFILYPWQLKNYYSTYKELLTKTVMHTLMSCKKAFEKHAE
jgi:hypothetical protein